MTKQLIAIIFAVIYSLNLSAQTQTPGLDVLGYGYDVFGNYADQASKKRYCLFKYSNFRNTPIGSSQYSVPQYVFLENISKHKITTVSGESMREYSKSQSATVGLEADAMFFSASVNTSFNSSQSGSERYFYYTYRDANTKWRISFDERNYDDLSEILDPQFKKDLISMAPDRLFELYGTHYIARAYLGGRADFNTTSIITKQTNTKEISVAVEAKYHSVSANSTLNKKNETTLSNSKTTTKLTVTGGNSEYANNISESATYEKWASGIATMPVLCDFDGKSLKPIWDLCKNSTRKSELKAEFQKMIKAHPLPAAMVGSMGLSNQVFFIRSIADSYSYFDIARYHFDADRKKGASVKVWEKDNVEKGLQGIDRFIKIITHSVEHDYAFLQPQHSDMVFTVKGKSLNTGAKIVLEPKGNNNSDQMFKMLEVDGKKNTYYIINKHSGFYLTYKGKHKDITQEKGTKAENQQWKFEIAQPTEMAPVKTNVAFAIQNVRGNRYMDLAGNDKNTKSKDGHIKLWDMDYRPDRYAKLLRSNLDDYYYVQQMHSKYVWDIEGGKKNNGAKLQLWDRNNSEAQQFKFIYAGSPMTFYIQNNGSNRYLDASTQGIDQNGCPIQIWDKNKNDNQKWKLYPLTEWYAPKRMKVKVQVAYSNKTWDLAGGPEKAHQKDSKLQIWTDENATDRYYVIKSSGEDAWVWIELDGGKRIDVAGGKININRTRLQTWDRNNSNAQKFAIHPTGRYTCIILAKSWKALDIESGELNKNGAHIIIWDQHYGPSQQFKLIDAATGKPIDFSKY